MFNRLRAAFRPSAPAAQAVEAPTAVLDPIETPTRPARIPPHMRHIHRPIEEHLSIYQTARIVPSNDTGPAPIPRRRRRAA